MTDSNSKSSSDGAGAGSSPDHPLEQTALLAALDNTTINYYRYFPKENTLVLPEATAREWACETVYTNVPESVDFFAYLVEEDKPAFLEMFHRINAGSPMETVSFRLEGLDRWCRVTMTTVARDEDGSPLEAIAIIEDRTEDMSREEMNRVRNETLSFLTQVFQVAASATDATVVVFDYETKTVTAPEETASLWGVPAEHPNGPEEIADSGIIMPESRDAYLSIHERMLAGAPEARTKVKLRAPDGGIETHELAFRAIKDANGKPIGKAVGVYSNISDFEERSEHKAAMAKALLQGINAAFFVDLDNGRFTLEEFVPDYIGGTIERFVSSKEAEGDFAKAIERFCEKLVCEEDRDRMAYELSTSTIIEKLQSKHSYFVQYRMSDNPEGQEHFEVHIASTDHMPGNNAFISFRCIDEQKTREMRQQQALKEAYLAAQQASKAKSEFFSRMSHDIRTPMNAIVGMTALAKTHMDDAERVADCLNKISLSSNHLLGLINDVLDMSKIESGMVDLNFEGFDLSKLVENLISMSRHLIEEKDHELLVNVHDIHHEKVVGDPQRIQQAFMNLMGNAVKYTPPGGTIRLSIRERPVTQGRMGCYEFVFEDNGIGMDSQFLEHIFEPFARASDERVDEQQGTGLGMAITHNIVQMMSGSIAVESEPNVGSKFTVTIYLEIQQEEEQSSISQLDGLGVLVVDDDIPTCEGAYAMLLDMGMRPEWVTSGRDAVSLVKARHEDGDDYFAVIVDWKMPIMDGLETTRAIREEVGSELPVIIISAYDWSEIEAPARNAGADGFISKPLFRSRLLHQFKRILDGGIEEHAEKAHGTDSLFEKDYSGSRVLLVEDNVLNREIALEFFEMSGLHVDVAENGRIAVDMMEACEDGLYDMVFMDIQMPVMNGYDATRAIRSSSRDYLKSVPIVAMTADAFAEDVNAARAAGMNEHIAKPIDLEKLAGVLERYLA